MRSHLLRLALALVAAASLAAASGEVEKPRIAAAPDGKAFATPEEAVTAFIASLETHDHTAQLAVLGSAAKPLIDSGDAADRYGAERFVESYKAAHEIQRQSDTRAQLVTGADDFPFPIPLVKDAAGWRFDTAAGQEEVLARRIGRNERFTIQACLAFID